MITLKTLYEKIRPRRLSPREIQEQLDVKRATALTMAYAKTAGRVIWSNDSKEENGPLDREALAEEVEALTHREASERSQMALNNQMVTYLRIVDEVRRMVPPSGEAGAAGSVAPRLEQGSVARQHGQTRGEAMAKAWRESWRSEKLKEAVRDQLGFCPAIKESTIPGAGVGLFVEGSAPEGAVVAIYPGLVHLPENLKDRNYMGPLLPDDDFFLMGRADGCIIDARTRDQFPSSPLTLGHAVNHPPRGRKPNALQSAYDYPSSTREEKGGIFKRGSAQRFLPADYRELIPNRYNVEPRLLGGKVNRFALAETVVLVACEGGIHDEEVFMDYRFNPDMRAPNWYYPVDVKQTSKMWASTRKSLKERLRDEMAALRKKDDFF